TGAGPVATSAQTPPETSKPPNNPKDVKEAFCLNALQKRDSKKLGLNGMVALSYPVLSAFHRNIARG
ncbi:MAG: hypothetical protein ACO29C_05315, partial [Fluviibacter sp.]